MWVFREGKKEVSTERLADTLAIRLQSARLDDEDALQDALIRSGELESALTDCAAPAASTLVALTDALADAFVQRSPDSFRQAQSVSQTLAGQALPREILVSPPEGFAFYALQPADFAAAAASVAPGADLLAIIGIRSIGTTLSALSRAALRARGASADRITVRPTGHPFDRVTQFTVQQRQWIARFLEQQAVFIVVDEGPGMSGSSFLSVAEALEAEGVAQERISLIGSREPDLERLCARDAPRRWRQYSWQRAFPRVVEKYSAHSFFGSGFWRRHYLAEENWPACWTQMERLKFLSPDRAILSKFEGLGRFGQEVRERSEWLARAGFASPVSNSGDGMSAYSYIHGTPLCARDATPEVLYRMAEYCAFRRTEFPVVQSSREQLAQMVAFNLDEEFGAEPACNLEPLRSSRPQVVDGRMHPHEWMRDEHGRLWKHDAATHGDDHFFPGPTDIAWDLAGVMVEWQLDSSASQLFLRHYAKLAGDDPTHRLPAYLLAYSVFRMGYCNMAADAESGTAEAPRLHGAFLAYRQLVEKQMACAFAGQ